MISRTFTFLFIMGLIPCIAGCGGGGGSTPDKSSSVPGDDTGTSGSNISFIKGPYLQNVKPTEITIMWETDATATSRVDFGPDTTYTYTKKDQTRSPFHDITLTDLLPGTTYFYQVSSSDPPSTVVKSGFTFKTAPDPESQPVSPFTIAVYGDSRFSTSIHTAIVDDIIADKPDIVLHTGDIVSFGTDYTEWKREFFDPAKNLISSTPLYPVLGNHEFNTRWYYNFFSLPSAESGSMTEAWYSFDYGNTHITALDSDQDLEPGCDQYNWFVNDISSQKSQAASWRIVFFHHPVFSSGLHGGNENEQLYLVPVMEKNHVNIVLNGHDHLYERSFKSGIYYIVTAGGGANLYPTDVNPNPYKICGESIYHYCLLNVKDAEISFQAKSIDGMIIDSFTIKKERDLEVIDLEAPDYAYQDDLVHVAVEVANTGHYPEEDISVSLVCETAERNIGVKNIATLSPGENQLLSFDWLVGDTPSADQRLVARIHNSSKENNTSNNLSSCMIRIYKR